MVCTLVGSAAGTSARTSVRTSVRMSVRVRMVDLCIPSVGIIHVCWRFRVRAEHRMSRMIVCGAVLYLRWHDGNLRDVGFE